MYRDIKLAALWEEWLNSPVKSRTIADYEVSGLLSGMKRCAKSEFATSRLIAARRLSGPSHNPLWPLTSYSQKFPLSISMITRTHSRPSVRFACPSVLLRQPKGRQSSWSWLKGIWGSAGSIYFPKSGYYLALRISEARTAEAARTAMQHTGLSWNERGNEFTLRSHEDIMTFLCNAGMPSSALEFDQISLMRSLRSRANRESNYDSANIERTLRASREQLILAEEVISRGLMPTLPEKLRELVKLRLEYPEETLSGLGRRLTPPITKASVNYRWHKIQSILNT